MAATVREPKAPPIRKRHRCEHKNGCTTVIGHMVWKPTKAYVDGFKFEPGPAFGGIHHLRQLCRRHLKETA